ncbi:uncharacterized protein BXIN_2963 [Babesia sp. Xinjiang]|uniref:uncharacterized protein n=1 Tax=Babesia sp. Xinjiang TaxID=462227 RepID=UPI000A244E76|nr:uncharacterized protein BXIN_2963 [Babesia sp. Xinjiang]ORM39419.1 hypothetical protein BXIN_2963 [Babesia sp. Xinjiang]
MVGCRSSCLVPLSQLVGSQIGTNLQAFDGINSGHSCEVVISYRVERSYLTNQSDDEMSSSPSQHGDSFQNTDSPVYQCDVDRTITHTPTGSAYDAEQNADIEEIHTPQKRELAIWRNVEEQGGIIPVHQQEDTAPLVPNGESEIRRIAIDDVSSNGTVNVDYSTIHERIISKILRDAEERQIVVTFVNDVDDDERFIDGEVEHTDADDTQNIHKDGPIAYALDDAIVDPQCKKEKPQEETQLLTSDIEWFNSAIRFLKMKEFKGYCHPFAESEKESHSLDSCLDKASQDDSTLFKSADRRSVDEKQHTNEHISKLATAVENLGGLKLDTDLDFSFIRKRKRSGTATDATQKSDKMKLRKSPSSESTMSTNSQVRPGNYDQMQTSNKEREKIGDHQRPRDRRRSITELFRNYHSDDNIDATDCKSFKELRIDANNTSLERSLSHSRPDGSGHRESSSNKDAVSKRGKLADACNSSGSTSGIKPARPKHISGRIFEAAMQQNSDWSSEMWGSFINVIHSRKRTLGHGSFSTVSFAFLRLTPSLKLAAARSNVHANLSIAGAVRDGGIMVSKTNTTCYKVISSQGSNSNDDDNGNSFPSGSSGEVGESGNNVSVENANAAVNNGNENEGDLVDQMCDVIDGHCEKCTNVRTLDCAVKTINDVFLQARFQYIREKEMMLHFNANVLKPLACRFHNPEGTRVYQLLMPKAQGDLLEMLKGIIKHRTVNNVSPIYIANQSTGKQERKIIGLSETEVKFLFFQVLSGLAFIQMCFQGNIYRHSDIKLQNILVFCSDDNKFNPMRWRLCLADFGCSIMLHPTQHLEGAGLFKNLQESISKEWRSHLCNQLTSFVRGTVRCNAPETLSYDRHGNPRSNRNSNLLSSYRRDLLNVTRQKDDGPQFPAVWSQNNISENMAPGVQRKSERVVGTADGDVAEYFTVNMTADMWSAGIVLAELAKFGGYVPPNDTPIDEKDVQRSKSDALSLEYVTQRLNGTLGRGMFCRNNAVVRLKMQLESARDKTAPKARLKPLNGDKAHQNNQGPLTDENLNMALASDIASKCDIEFLMRVRKLKREYCWWEYPKFSNGFWSLLGNLLSYKPHERYLAFEALGHSWFDSSDNNSRAIFNDIDALMAEPQRHLPMEHFYYVGLSLSIHNGAKKAQNISDTAPLTVKREALMDLDNSDLVLRSLGDYGKAGRTTHAWFAGPLHFRLHELQELGLAIPDYVAQICRRETVVLESREKQLFGVQGYVLSQLLSVKRRHMLSWSELMSARGVHLLGKNLIQSENPLA